MSLGLEIIVFLDTEEYLNGITPIEGLQVVVHPQNTLPFPDDEGIAVSSGSSTMISLKLVSKKLKR